MFQERRADLSRKRSINPSSNWVEGLPRTVYSWTQFDVSSWAGRTRNWFVFFEKIRDGIWVYNGLFRLVDAWQETSDRRQVFKFKLEIVDQLSLSTSGSAPMTDRDRVIPSVVKLEVWKRDKGACVRCGSRENLHFDHIIPYSQGGSSRDAENIQILCARHNLEKRDRIE